MANLDSVQFLYQAGAVKGAMAVEEENSDRERRSGVADAAVLAMVAGAYQDRFRPDTGNSGQVVYRVRPRVVLSWVETDFTRTATRWLFGAS